jgi:hypothetical protein
MDTYVSHMEALRTINNQNRTITANGVYTVDTTSGYTGNGTVTVNVSGSSVRNRRYLPGEFVYADNGETPIGICSGLYVDSNDIEYAVVCLNASDRATSKNWTSATGAVTNMPNYGHVNTAAFGFGTESATTNCDLIMDWVNASSSRKSTAIAHCRSKSYVIDGTTYYGQLPNICELLQIFSMHHYIYTNDPTSASAGTTLNFATWPSTASGNTYAWSSSQYSSAYSWCVSSSGSAYNTNKNYGYFVAPVLEIPNH